MSTVKIKIAGIAILLGIVASSFRGEASELELSANWKMASMEQVNALGEEISKPNYLLNGWQAAIIP
nr:hypothetical protein [Sunxiuqinia sp.]